MAVFSPLAAQAATTGSTLAVSATVLSSCTVSPAVLAFGNYSGSTVDTTTTISVLCTSGSSYAISLDTGANTVSFTPRVMSDGATGTLNYDLYTDSGHTTVWGDGTSGTSTVTATGSGVADSHTVYGSIPASQLSAPAGAYTDTVNITVTY